MALWHNVIGIFKMARRLFLTAVPSMNFSRREAIFILFLGYKAQERNKKGVFERA